MNISLIGMMGSGKSTVAKILAKHLNNFSFVDTDDIIVAEQNMSINQIFKEKGEEKFRQIETEVLKKVLSSDNQIISTGGGIVISDNNLQLLKRKSLVFYLYADEETLYQRVKDDNKRPLLNDSDINEKIHLLLNNRTFQYEQAHYKIDTRFLTPEKISEEIIRKAGIDGNS